MKKKKNHKWKYRINVRKKVVVLIILGVLLFVGMGYAIINSDLGIGGTLEVSKYANDKTFYSALKKEVKNGYAAKYTGSHQDSMDSTKSTKNIYHFYADTEAKGTEIMNKNNVVFANMCWQMIRTTDTGGVKLLYNGEPEEIEVDGETKLNCGDTRTPYHMGSIITDVTVNLNGSYKYAKNYTISTNGNTITFTLVDDPEDPDDCKNIGVYTSNADETIADIIENYPYTCRNTSGTCNLPFYKVVQQYKSGETRAFVYSTTGADNVGSVPYKTGQIPAYTGYMYGDIYSNNIKSSLDLRLELSQDMVSSNSFYNTYKYSQTLNVTESGYELDNPVLGSEISGGDYTGYYTFRSSTKVSGERPYYLAGKVNSTNYYYVLLDENKQVSDFNIMTGTDYVANGDGTYTLKNGENPATTVTIADWVSRYTTYKGKYTCGDTTDTCQDIRYITYGYKEKYNYIAGFITIAKERNGLNLVDYVTIDGKGWYNGYNTTYSDYIYTCGNADIVCTGENLKIIISKYNYEFTYVPNQYIGSSVIYEDGVYKLQDIVGLEGFKFDDVKGARHYYCTDINQTECSSVAYSYGSGYYILLDNPAITSGEAALESMLTKNVNNSTAKDRMDYWYKNLLKDTIYENKIDDVIYCNDRSFSPVSGYTFEESGWNSNGTNYITQLYYKNGAGIINDLSCENVTDRFSVSNGSAQLTYMIGLPTAVEMNLLNQDSARKTFNDYITMTPKFSSLHSPPSQFLYGVSKNGSFKEQATNSSTRLRPMIALKAGTKYSSGTGKMTDPYIVDMSE